MRKKRTKYDVVVDGRRLHTRNNKAEAVALVVAEKLLRADTNPKVVKRRYTPAGG